MTARKTGLVPITGAQGKILVPKHIRIVPQFAAENRLQSSLDIDSEIPVPVMCALIRTKGIYELNPEHRPLLHIDAKLGAELVSALGSRGNDPLANGKETEGPA